MRHFNTFKRWAVIIKLVEEAEKKESRVGHTFIQKLIYLLQELFEIPLGYTFYIYYYGPYSDEVWGDLTAMQDTGFLTITADPSGYGYRIKTMNGEKKKWIKNKVKDLPEDRIEELVELLRDQPVRILELIATTTRMENLLKIANPDEALYRELMLALGYKNNKVQFLELAMILP